MTAERMHLVHCAHCPRLRIVAITSDDEAAACPSGCPRLPRPRSAVCMGVPLVHRLIHVNILHNSFARNKLRAAARCLEQEEEEEEGKNAPDR